MQAEWSDLAPYMKGKKSKTDFTERDLARAMLDNLDRNIGRLLAFLKQAKLEDNTLVIHTSDNGGHDEGPGRVVQHNGGLRPRKGLLYEGRIRVPMMIRWPGRIPAGVTSSQPVSHLDVVPTILAAVRARPDPTRTLDGLDLLPIIAAPARGVPPERDLYWGFDHKSRWAVRSGPWKLVYESTNIPNWHLIFDAAKPTTPVAKDAPPVKVLQLYHLADDPAEAHNVAAAHPEVVERLQRSIDAFNASTRPSLYTPEVRRQHEAILAERAKDPALANIKRRDGIPGLWRVGD